MALEGSLMRQRKSEQNGRVMVRRVCCGFRRTRLVEAVQFLVHLMLLCSVSGFAADVRSYLRRPAEWFKTEEAARIGTNILSWQAPRGGWPKNVDTVSALCTNTN